MSEDNIRPFPHISGSEQVAQENKAIAAQADKIGYVLDRVHDLIALIELNFALAPGEAANEIVMGVVGAVTEAQHMVLKTSEPLHTLLLTQGNP